MTPPCSPLEALHIALREELAHLSERPLAALRGVGSVALPLPASVSTAIAEHQQELAALLRPGPDGSLAPEVEQLCQVLAGYASGYVALHNQFLSQSPDDIERLVALHREALCALGSAAGEIGDRTLDEIAGSYLSALEAWVRSLWRGPDDAADFVFTEQVCSEYSPEVQIEILGLDPEAIAQPLLDIGCGPGARLVRHLRGLGVEAYGIDRLVLDSEETRQCDWLLYDFAPRSWGSLVAHLGFTNHFVFHDQCGGDEVERYAVRYLAMLGSLRTGGCFYYAPAVPFIEAHLPPAAFRIRRRRLPDQARAIIKGQFAREVTPEAVRVERLT